jgi:hypothetical protein
MEEGLIVVTLAGTLASLTSYLKKMIMKKKETVGKNIVRAALQFGRDLIFHWIAIILIFGATHLFVPGDVI